MSEVSTPPRVAVPSTVTNAIRMVWVIVGLTGLTAVMSAIFRDDLVLAWAEGNPEAEKLVQAGGLEALEKSSITIPALVPLAFSLFAVFAGLALVLVAFLRGGHNWARLSIAALAVFAIFVTGLSIVRGLPPVFLILAGISMLAYGALLWLLFHKETSAYIRAF